MTEREIAETPEMVERVARALCANQIRINRRYDTPDLTEDMVRSGVEYAWPDLVGEARVAIEAMREPTEGMISARFHKLGSGGRAEWQAMIDAALAETP